jgi:hypothetical protein
MSTATFDHLDPKTQDLLILIAWLAGLLENPRRDVDYLEEKEMVLYSARKILEEYATANDR